MSYNTQKQEKSHHSKFSVEGETECTLITQIRAVGVAAGLRRIPIAFYVVVRGENLVQRTSNKSVSVHKDAVEWNDEIVLLLDRTSSISLTVFASFEMGSMLGDGEFLREFKLDVGRLLDCNDGLELVGPLDQTDGMISSLSSFKVKTEKKVYRSASPHPTLEMRCSEVEWTNKGHSALTHYRELEEQKDLDESIKCFQLARDLCSPDPASRATCLFNLATAQLIYCRMNNVSLNLDVPIDLYRDALRLRPCGHPDHAFTLLSLGIAIQARFQRQHHETDAAEAENLLTQVLDISPPDSYAYYAAVLALSSTAKSELLQPMEVSQPTEDDIDDNRVVQRLDVALKWIFHPDMDKNVILDHLGVLFCVHFDSIVDQVDPEKAISLLEVIVQSTPDGHPVKPSWLDDLGHLFLARYEHSGNIPDLEKSILALEEAVRFTPKGHPDKSLWLDNLGRSLMVRYSNFENPVDLDKAISVREEAVRSTLDGHPSASLWLSNLGHSFLARFQRCGDIVDLDKSISMSRDAVQSTPDGDTEKISFMNNLGSLLYLRYEHFSDAADLKSSISILEEAVRLAPGDDPDKCLYLNNLCNSLSTRYQRFGDINDLQKSILILENGVQSTFDHPAMPKWLDNLGRLLLARYERLGDIADLAESLSLRERAVQSTSDDDPQKGALLSTLGVSLITRYERFGNDIDLTKSISMLENGVQLTPGGRPEKPVLMNQLGCALLTRFRRFGDFPDLERSISMHKDAVRLTPDEHSNKKTFLNNIGEALLTRYEHSGDDADLQNSVSVLEDAVRSTPDDHPDQALWFSTLAYSLLARYTRFGDVIDLERSVSMGENALEITPDGHAEKPERLGNLAGFLLTRYEHFGDAADLERSILMLEEAAESSNSNKQVWTSNLSYSLSVRYQRLKNVSDLERSISLRRDIVQSTPDGHLNKPSQLTNLGTLILSRFERSQDAEDLESAISTLKDATQLTPNEHPSKLARLSNLGHSLLTRYRRFGDVADLEESLLLFEDAVNHTPDDHPDKPSRLNALAQTLLERFQRSGNLPDPDLARAVLYTSHAARMQTGPSLDRFRASQLWVQCVRLLSPDDGSQSLLDAYTAVIDLLPQLAWIGLSFHDRHYQLLQAAGEACDAAAAALEANQSELAVEWLEQGRSIVWSQLSQLRTPVDDLRTAHPVLAAQFERVSYRLERAAAQDRATLKETNLPLENQAQQHHALALERTRLLAEIRGLPNFELFLLPKTIGQLSSLVRLGPAIFLNASKYRCDALIVTPEGERVVHVPLLNTCYDEAVGTQLQLSKLLGLTSNRVILSDELDRGARLHKDTKPDEVIRPILLYLWTKVVSPVLDALTFSIHDDQISPGHKLPRIFWCPTGPFSFLPIHAAGHFDKATPGPKLSGFAISSYIPTISALEPSPHDLNLANVRETANNIRLLMVPQPSTDGQRYLSGVPREMEVIKELASLSSFVCFDEADGTVEAVLGKMAETDWVHFACHGTQNRISPLDSGLLLANCKLLRLSDIVQLSRPRGGLAFLSACQTATGDEQLSEEAVHLAAGMLLAGYGSVIATMWSISDSYAPNVAEHVYRSLFRDGEFPDSKRAAEALHGAIERLHESGAPFLSWVPFIHIGI